MLKKEIEKLIESYEKKAAAAEANYRDTGYDRYFNAVQRNEGMASFLRNSLESKERAERGDMLQREIDDMASKIKEFRYLSPQRKDEELGDTVMRQSGTADTLEVNCPQLVLETVETGDKLCLEGQVRSYAKTIDGKSRLSVALFALKVQEHKADCNEVELEGYLCEKPEFRTTPRGRDICYAMLAVNRERGKSDYIPQVFWGRTAKRVSEMQVGTQISLSGRLQSRSYTKKNATRTVFEVSVGKVSEGGSNDA